MDASCSEGYAFSCLGLVKGDYLICPKCKRDSLEQPYKKIDLEKLRCWVIDPKTGKQDMKKSCGVWFRLKEIL